MLGKERREREFAQSLLTALRAIEEQLRTLTAALSPIEKQENANSTDEPGEAKKTLPRPRAAIKVVTESSESDTKQRKTEHQQQYWLQWRSLQAQRYLLYATLLAFGAAAYYGWVARQQLATMNETLKEAHIQNVAQQRALLAVTEPPTFLDNGELAIRIKNIGHLPATITRYRFAYRQDVMHGRSFTRRREAKPGTTIAAEDYYDLGVWLPPIPGYLLKKGTTAPLTGPGIWEVSISVYIEYDSGFGDTERLFYCSFFYPADRTWGNSCLSPNIIDLSRESTDTPDTTHK